MSRDGVRPFVADLEVLLNLSALLGRPRAFIGFTGSTGETWANLDILHWEWDPFGASLLRALRHSIETGDLPTGRRNRLLARVGAALRAFWAQRKDATCRSLNSVVRDLWQRRHPAPAGPARDEALLIAVQLGCRGPLELDDPLLIESGFLMFQRWDYGAVNLTGPSLRLIGEICSWECASPPTTCGEDGCTPGEELHLATDIYLEWIWDGRIGPWALGEGRRRASANLTFEYLEPVKFHQQRGRFVMRGVVEGQYSDYGPVVIRANIRGSGTAGVDGWPRDDCDAFGCWPTDVYELLDADYQFTPTQVTDTRRPMLF